MDDPAAIARRAVELTATRDRDAAVDELISMAGHRRRPLEEAAAVFLARLHRRSDDFEATRALQLLYRALGVVGWDTATAPAAAARRPRLPETLARAWRTRRPRADAQRHHPQPAAA